MEKKRRKIVFGVLASAGIIGVLGQTAILHNSLVHSYPFKMMGVPNADFYESVGNVGYYSAILGGLVEFLVSLRLPRLFTSILPVILCPLVYWLVFELAHITQGFTREQMMERNFDGYTGNAARYEFGFMVLTLLFFGAIVGGSLGFITRKVAQMRQNQLS